MEAWEIILLSFGASLVLFWIASYFIVAAIVYNILLVRTSPQKWSRECSLKDDEEQKRMYAAGNEWCDRYSDKLCEVSITSDGFRLVGEYINFGFDKAVIIIAGRTEGCKYSYYFAEPYRQAGYNVLVIDNRCHGFSEGKYVSLGLKEYKDILRWGEFLYNEHGNQKIVLHGICIGSATALYALTASECPSYFAGMVADGMYVDFKESIKNHMIEQNRKNIRICLKLLTFYFRLRTGKKMVQQGPLSYIGQLQKPILFIYSKQDIYSVPEKGQLLYDTCQCKKQLAWFERGAHSKVRINNTEKYDNTVIEFLAENVG